MVYQVLARKWRPTHFSQVIGQNHVTKAMQNALKHHTVGHAYLLVGTRGVGKTTLARLFAKAIRCERRTSTEDACGECSGCVDSHGESSLNVIEIDGASNNSVDNVRDLVNNVHFLPSNGGKKIYIIDEVHMLTTSAFNALLKTLEEPPPHVVFILATTEPQKLLGTVLSRCHRFDLKSLNDDLLALHLQAICHAEKISISQEGQQKIAQLGRGSVRDALSLLDQCLAYSENSQLDEGTISYALGVLTDGEVKKLIQGIYRGDRELLRNTLRELHEKNIPLKNIAEAVLNEVFLHLEKISMAKNILPDIEKSELIWIFENIAKELPWVLMSVLPEKTLEVLFLKVLYRREYFSPEGRLNHSETVTDKAPVVAPAISQAVAPVVAPVVEPVVVPVVAPEPETPKEEKNFESFLIGLRKKAPATATNLEQGVLVKPLTYDDKSVFLELGFKSDGKVFFDYLNETTVLEKIKGHLASYFQVELSQIHFQMILLGNENDKMSELKTQAEIFDENILMTKKNREETLKNNPLIKNVEKLFNTKVDKVIIDKK